MVERRTTYIAPQVLDKPKEAVAPYLPIGAMLLS